MPKAFPMEFRQDVIRVYKSSDSSMAKVAKDLGVSPSCLKRSLAIDERSSSRTSGSSRPGADSDALRDAYKRIKLLEQENEAFRRAAAYLSTRVTRCGRLRNGPAATERESARGRHPAE